MSVISVLRKFVVVRRCDCFLGWFFCLFVCFFFLLLHLFVCFKQSHCVFMAVLKSPEICVAPPPVGWDWWCHHTQQPFSLKKKWYSSWAWRLILQSHHSKSWGRNDYQASQGYIVRPCFIKANNRQKVQTAGICMLVLLSQPVQLTFTLVASWDLA